MSESKNEKKPSAKGKDVVFRMKEVPLDVAIDETGEFRCVPDPSACQDKEGARNMFVAFKNMPSDRRAAWVPRLDQEETFKRCPTIKQDVGLSKEFDELCAANDRNKPNRKQTGQHQRAVSTTEGR